MTSAMDDHKIRQLHLRMQNELRRLEQRAPNRCFALGDSGAPCPNPPVNTHTLARSTFLRKLAENGHVYSYNPRLNRLAASGPPISVPEKRGIKNTSTFPGFCQAHDDRLFSVIEKEPFENTVEQVFMLAYRATCYELYIKTLDCDPKSRYIREKYEKRLPKYMHDTLSRIRTQQATGAASGLRDLQRHKAAYDEALASKRFSEVTGYTIEIGGDPILMCCSGITPTYDFRGRLLQDMQDDDVFGKMVAVTAFADRPGQWYVVLAWHHESEAVGRQLIDSLLENPRSSSIAALIFVHCGNLHFRISWWDNLAAETREWLASLWTLTAMLPGHSQELQTEMPLPQWDIRRIERCG